MILTCCRVVFDFVLIVVIVTLNYTQQAFLRYTTMKIDLTMKQLVKLCHILGYGKFLPATEGYIDTEKNVAILYGPTCPIDEPVTDEIIKKVLEE